MKKINIAVDGPSGAGKTTIARTIAGKYGFVYLDTGSLYRSIGLYTLRKGADPDNAEAVSALLPEISIKLEYISGEQHVMLNGEDVSRDIRNETVSMYASKVSAIPVVRDFLMNMQRDMAKEYNCILDGRDIGTVVLPDAGLKIFLTASAEERAKRRCTELIQKGMPAEYSQVLADIKKRDLNDSTRKTAPLKKADDAIEVDSTTLPLDEMISKIDSIIKDRFADVL